MGLAQKTSGHHRVARSGILAPGVRVSPIQTVQGTKVRARPRWTTMVGGGRVGQQCHGGAVQGQLQGADESEGVRG